MYFVERHTCLFFREEKAIKNKKKHCLAIKNQQTNNYTNLKYFAKKQDLI